MARRPAAVLSILVTASTGEADAKLLATDKTLRGVAGSAKSLEGRMTKTGAALTRSVTLPILAVGAAAGSMALKFDRSMSLIATQAGGSHREVKQLSKAVLELAKHSEFSPEQLSKGLYYIESAGKRGAEAMKTLNVSQKLAAVGNSDVERTTFALIGAQNALGKEGKSAIKTAAEMNAIVGHGHMRMEDFADSLSSGTIGVAQSFGITFKSLGATVDFFTKRGETADTAMTRLKQTLTHLGTSATKKGADALKEIGISTEHMAAVMQQGRIGPVVKELAEHLQSVSKIKANQILAEAFGGGRYGAQIRMLVQNVGDLLNLEREVGKAGGVKALNKDFKETREQGLYKLHEAWSSIQAALIETGQSVIPLLVPAFQKVAGAISGARKAFSALPQATKSSVVDALAFTAALGPALWMGGKLVGMYKTLAGTFEAIAASNVVSGLAGGLGDLRAAFGLGLPGLRMLGGEWGGALIGGMTKVLPGLAAAAGIGNIVVSASKGDWRQAGFKAGGALVGGIAGAFLGPEGAMIGVGAGSALGGLLEPLFESSKHLTPLQRQLQETAKHTAIAFKSQQDAAQKLAGAERRLQAEQEHSKRTSQAVHQAEAKLASDRRVFGSDSLRVRKDELLLAEAKAKNNTATKRLNELQQLSGNRLKVYRFETTKAVAADKERVQALRESKAGLERRLHAEEASEVPLVKQMQTRKRLANVEEATEKQAKALSRILEEAAVRVSPHYAKSLNNMNLAQAQFGKHLSGLRSKVLSTTAGMSQSAEGFEQAWLTMAETTDQHTMTWNRVTLAGIRSIMSEVSNASQSLGVNKVEFHIAGKKAQGHQQGGFTVPGAGAGDSFHAAIPAGSFVLNREATAAFGFQGGGHVPVVLEPRERVFMPHEVAAIGPQNLAAMNASVPRFQKGGQLGPEPMISGPSGALRSLGQAAIHEVYQGAKHYLAKHKGTGVAVPGGGGAVVAQIARVLFANGFNKIGAAGIIGNAYRESGWNPGAIGTGGGGLWGFTSGAISLAALQAAAKRAGVPWTDVPFQTGFMLRHGGMRLRGALNRAGSAGDAARVFMEQWERPGIPALGEREAAARKALSMGYQHGGLIGHQKDGVATDPYLARKWAGWSPSGIYGRFAKGGSVKKPKVGSPSDVVDWATRRMGSTDHWGYPGEWCGAFLAADMRANHLPVPSGFASAASWGGYGKSLGRNNMQAGAILDYGGAHVALAVSTSKQIQGNDIHGQVGTSGIGGIIGGSPLTAVRWPPYEAAPGAGGNFTEKVPAMFHGAHTKSLHFPSIPKNLRGVEREIHRWEREIRIYRHAVAAATGAPATQRALEHNVKAIENQLRQLRNARTKLRKERARRKFTGKLQKGLGKITGHEQLIEARQRNYEIASQRAEQLVDLEPQEPILPQSATEAERESSEKAYVQRYSAYIEGQERPAYSEVLGKLAEWRNEILHAEYAATGIEKSWEGGTHKRRHHIAHMESFIEKAQNDLAKYRSQHPKGTLPDWLQGELEEMHRYQNRLPMVRFQKQGLEKVLGEGRESFYGGEPFGIKKPIGPRGSKFGDVVPAVPLAGTGSFEEHLKEVQGLHWPDQHEFLAAIALAPPRQAGRFGGAIWDAQTSIEELGLKIQQASANIGGAGSGGSEGKTEREALLEEELLHERQRKATESIELKTLGSAHFLPYAGGYASGGLVAATVGENGREIAAFPTGTRIHNASESRSMLSPEVRVHVHGDIVSDHPDPVQVTIGDKRFPAAVEQITGKNDRRSARNARRHLAKVGV